MTEMQENIKTRKGTLRVAYEEIKKLRKDLAQEDKNKSHVLSRESLEEGRNLKLQELCLTASKRMAGASDGGDCHLDCRSRSNRVGDLLKKEKNPRGGREGKHQRRHQDVRRGHGRIGWLSVIVKAQAWILQATSEWRIVVEQEGGGTVRRYRRLFDPEKVLSWSVARLSEDSTDLFLSQFSMLTSWDILLFQECFTKWMV